jgi:SAM-dependent methyltransferase
MSGEERVYTVCPICHVTDTILEFPLASGPAREVPLARCRRCGLVFQQLVRSLEQLDEAQSEAYGEPQKRFGGPVERAIRCFRSARVRLAVRLMPEGGHTLDIGCGRGLYLRLLKERGFQIRGTELSTATAANADSEVPIDIGELEPGRYPDASFDLISIWHVLEHLQRPDRTLTTCVQALKPGGALMIAVPNYGSPQARFGGERWFHLDLPRHIFHFTESTLRRLLGGAGFGVESCVTGQWEMDPFGWLQTGLNRMGLRHNALYDTLRNNTAAKRDLSRLYRAAMLAVFPFGMLMAVATSGLCRLSNRAGTLIVVARKPEKSKGDAESPPQSKAEDE